MYTLEYIADEQDLNKSFFLCLSCLSLVKIGLYKPYP